MRAKIKYSDEALGDLEVVDDFLPSPDELAFKDETVKVTISLSKSSVQFFKEKAGGARYALSEDDSQTPRLIC